MTCPDLDRLIQYYFGEGDSEVEAHLASCATCRADIATMVALPRVWAKDFKMPDDLVDRIMSRLPAVSPPVVRKRITFGQGLVSGVLGGLTAAVALILAGSQGAGHPSVILVLSVAAGVCVNVSHMIIGSPAAEADPQRNNRDPR